MRAASVSLFVHILTASVAFTPHATFRYEVFTSYRRSGDSCQLCYADECIDLAQPRCRYYLEVDEQVFKKEEEKEPGLEGEPTEVDDMMYEMVEQASLSWTVRDCIPFISQYTDCTKENICLGCRICTCNADSRWNCSTTQRCQADTELEVDHRVLVMVKEKLMDGNHLYRRKRSPENSNKAEVVTSKAISLIEIAEWMYGKDYVNLKTIDVTPDSNSDATIVTESTSPQSSIAPESKSETEYIDFDEVLRNIAIDDQSYKRRKSKLNDHHDIIDDYIDDDSIKVYRSNDSDQFMNVLSAIEEGNDNMTKEPNAEGATFIIDLLKLVKRSEFQDDTTVADDMDINSVIGKETNSTKPGDDIFQIQLKAVDVMKRDVSSVTKFKSSTQATNTTDNNTNSENNLYDNVLVPLMNIIYDKESELKDLLHIKENLIKYFETFNKTGMSFNTSEREFINSSNTFLSIYKLDLFPQIQYDLRRGDPNILDKFFIRLKRDIYEVIKDIAGIQKLSKSQSIPEDLKLLIHAMRRYVRKQGNIDDLKKKDMKLKSHYNRNIIRKWGNEVYDNSKSIKGQLIDILELVDKKSLQLNGLMVLSQAAKKIVKRVIRQNYIDEFSAVGIRVFDPEYNLTNELRAIGNSWQKLIENVENSSQTDRLYAMKLLHFALCIDNNKLKDAISLIDFAHTRRMIPIEEPMAEKLIERISDGLNSINEKVVLLIKYQNKNKERNVKEDLVDKKVKKQSFFKRLKNMLRGSKKDIIDLVKKKVPKSEVIKPIAKKKLDEMNERKMTDFEKNMLKWQNNLNIPLRNKRAALNRKIIKNRIKSIIPTYLRGKVDPAIAKKLNIKKDLGKASKKMTSSNKKNQGTTTMHPKSTSVKLTVIKKN